MRRDVSAIILFDEDKRILLQHRSRDAKRLPDFWGFFGGGIENGESPEQALLRESKEELGYTPQNPRLVMVQEYEHEGVKNKKYIYMEEYNNDTSLHLADGQAMDWFQPQDTKKLKMIDHDREVIRYIKDKY